MLDTFEAIADPSRRQILHLLSRKKLSVNSLAENFAMSRPAVSKHIRILREAGFITIEEVGRERHCALKKDGFTELHQWLHYFESFWNKKLDALERFLESEQRLSKKKKYTRKTKKSQR